MDSYSTAKPTHLKRLHGPKVKACLECLCISEACSQICLEENQASLATICRDCADVCRLALQLENRGSPWAAHVWDLCSRTCQACADACEKVESPHCQDCAESCRKLQEVATQI
jgi:hypothetical protein